MLVTRFPEALELFFILPLFFTFFFITRIKSMSLKSWENLTKKRYCEKFIQQIKQFSFKEFFLKKFNSAKFFFRIWKKFYFMES